MKLALVYPRVKKQMHGMWAPLGIITLGTVLKESGHEVTCFDASFDAGLGRVLEKLKLLKPDLVGVTCITDLFANAAQVVQAAKENHAITVMGGPHPTIDPENTLRAIPELDYAIVGEGEEPLLDMLSAIDSGGDCRSLPGVAWRDGDQISTNNPAVPIKDLDTIPLLDRDILETHKHYLRGRAINMHVTRGCPYGCRFCQPTLQRLFGRKIRHPSPEKVVEEINSCEKKYTIHDYFFHDDLFTLNKPWLEGLVRALSGAGLIRGFRYVVNSRVDTFDEDRARLLKAMGVYYVLFGIESGSQMILDHLKKGTTVEQARAAFQLCRKYGFRTHAYILIGSPRETRETLKATEDLVTELKPHTMHVSIYTPLVGTHLAEECEREGRIQVKDYADLDFLQKRTSSGQSPIWISGLSYQDLLDCRARILRRRRLHVFADNLKELFRDLIRDPRLDKPIYRYKLYRKMKHYFG